MIQIYAIIALVLAAVFAGAGFYIKSLRAENAQMTQAYGIAAQTAIDNKAQLDLQIADRARVDRILLERDREYDHIAKSNGDLHALLDNLKRGNADVRAWADNPVPDGVRSLLSGAASAPGGGSAEAVPAGDAGGTHAAADDRHPDQ